MILCHMENHTSGKFSFVEIYLIEIYCQVVLISLPHYPFLRLQVHNYINWLKEKSCQSENGGHLITNHNKVGLSPAAILHTHSPIIMPSKKNNKRTRTGTFNGCFSGPQITNFWRRNFSRRSKSVRNFKLRFQVTLMGQVEVQQENGSSTLNVACILLSITSFDWGDS